MVSPVIHQVSSDARKGDDACLGTAADYAVMLDRLEIASYQRFSDRCSSGTEKLIALAAKSTRHHR
jgi:hypothetical protein